MPSLSHTHTYCLFKARTKGKKITDRVYRCADPGCSHYTYYELVLNKRSRCNLCGEEYILDRESLKRVKPRCLLCSETPRGRLASNAKLMMTNLFTNPIAIVDSFDVEDEPPEA